MDFNNILIGSDNPKALIDYYTKLFGEPAMADENYSGWVIGSGFVAVGGPQPGPSGRRRHRSPLSAGTRRSTAGTLPRAG